jgi:hypothetical protein
MTEFSSPQQPQHAAGFPARHPVYERDVEALIVAAQQHPLGTEFLTGGHLEAVAITFQVHAFTVDAARRVLRGE